MRGVCLLRSHSDSSFFRNLLGGKSPTGGRAKDRPPIGAWTQFSACRCRGRSHRAQAASAPDALATWVAIASIKPGERQS